MQNLINGDGNWGSIEVLEVSEGASFGSIGCEVCRVGEMLVERIGYVFIGVVGDVSEFY